MEGIRGQIRRSPAQAVWGRILAGLLFFAVLVCLGGRSASAKEQAKITACVLRSASRLQVTAECEPDSISGKNCYLFALPFDGGRITPGEKPLARIRKSDVMKFSVRVPKDKRQELLYAQFVIAQKRSGKYAVISNAGYITNPGKTAKSRYAFPQASSKKGLQVASSMVEDAVELNVRHSTLNIDLGYLLAVGGRRNSSDAIPYQYRGTTYWMDRRVIADYDRQLQALRVSDTVVSAVLLLSYRAGNTGLIHPKARKRGYPYYAWNLTSEKARQTFQAALTFLAERYSTKNSEYARIVNWIVGNEVESPKHWNYSGKMKLQAYAAQYAKQFRLVYTAVTSVYANARVYISLSHLWNANPHDSFTARETLEAFVQALGAQGYIPWNLAYHPYSSPLTEPKFWENKNGMVTAALTSPVINMGNLSVLTGYIRSTYGSSTRVILSEQGFTSRQKKKNVEAEQAAAIAYSYLITEADDMVDSFIMNRHVDHKTEVKTGLNLGLWTTSSTEWADRKKSSWTVFKYMDTSLSEKATDAALPVINITKWSDVIEGYSPALYEKVDLTEGSLQIVSRYKKGRKIPGRWKSYGAAGKISAQNSVYAVVHDTKRNPHSLWGFTQAFRRGLNMEKRPVLGTTLEISGARRRNALVKMRFYSGNSECELSQVIPCGKRVCLCADLSGWAFRGKISRIIITAEPVSGGWKKGAEMKMTRPVAGKRQG